MDKVRARTGWTGSLAESNLHLVLTDRDVWHVGEDARLARSSLRIHRQDMLEIFRFCRLILEYLRH